MPRTAKEMISPGERIPESVSIFASSLPAFTYTIVAGSIPTCETSEISAGHLSQAHQQIYEPEGKMGISLRVKR